MKRILFVLLSVMLLASCTLDIKEQPSAPVTPVEPEKKPEQPTTEPLKTVPQQPKLDSSLNWNTVVQPLVERMINANGVEKGKLLLVDFVKNNTTGSLQTLKATDAITNVVSSKQFFQVVSKSQAHVARQALGLSLEDSLGSRTKSIGLARYLNADYVLYSVVSADSGDNSGRNIEMQLMFVKTGEILWSGHSDIKE
ncbi:penicillin-binding protein activator LpoB [Xenorhabdus szentirmaii]|uniref:Penicillin-binding protein activator LpoB n=1 Tax=Xenorhabdus szentirmaii DSM 16338 TaxID=1427518 RepID=W1IU59_9GAMM|nr:MULTISPECIES: penicillin-binding protein activator LpoB [Xenorhabdus]MBD2781194.1 penicillin-binding protein activator LpoB [Xenorhabdus sp. 38]MBD2791061.1 penicillin-binding protein activator LpoB [Xenorhabdus sp. CUL]MBD2805119.1 penicillin-binding protein activator LpoB [Xenorhabdus sp. ZM]MBD2825311.1 penicillin-binding protein activator LpoB [Xenorhabdus sp. 5]CDL82017.1 putative fibronectin-binding protein [Xenorhabdus szentirmaii DSM 16338]